MQHTPKHTKKKPQKNRSPFLIDLVGENERIQEENEIRARKQRATQKREDKQTEQLLQAGRGNDHQELKNLRIEKRKIIDEEKRLRALLEIEKSNAHRKENRQAAVLAEKRRHEAKLETRREKNMQRIAEKEADRTKMLVAKHTKRG